MITQFTIKRHIVNEKSHPREFRDAVLRARGTREKYYVYKPKCRTSSFLKL